MERTRIMRPGKTAREHNNGTWRRHLENQDKRREWNRNYMLAAKQGGHKYPDYPKIGD